MRLVRICVENVAIKIIIKKLKILRLGLGIIFFVCLFVCVAYMYMCGKCGNKQNLKKTKKHFLIHKAQNVMPNSI